MAQELLNKYVWILDTLSRFKNLSLKELSERWKNSRFSNGEGLPRRTFYNYRRAIADIFCIEIKYNAVTLEYYIDETGDDAQASINRWMLNATSTNLALSDSKDISHRIILEDVPSAREHLGAVMQAIKENRPVEFDYAPYTRVNASRDVVLEPYFMNLLRQRWYVTGRSIDNKIKTYALDRMLKVKVLSRQFSIPEDFDLGEYTRNAFGVIFSQGEVYDVILKVDVRQSKYLRTLPLHASQEESVHDSYSLFRYRLRLTPDFLSELLSMGSSVTVLAPLQLRTMITDELRRTLENYNE